jgi:SPP1 gp7 family putative phage head morphogenesis protein
MSWSGNTIAPGSTYGDPRKQAEQLRLEDRARMFQARTSSGAPIHGMTPQQASSLNERMGSMMPRLASSNPNQNRRDIFGSELPKGANWDARRSAQMLSGGGGVPGLNSSAGGGRNMYTVQRPYQPEFESPDRQQYPVHRILANRYWRLFIKLDPVIGTGLDMYSEMPWSDVKLTGEGVEGEIREVYETMWESCSVLSLMPSMVKEFLGIGEVIPHCFFDDKEGMWTYIALHNPDNLEVIDAPFIKMEPIVEFVPDDQLRAILTSSDPDLQAVRQNLPPELVAKLYARQNIRINTEVNATFIPRKLHPYETRGTSILSRMWRILMYEDAIFNASIQTARRHAGPLKIAKLGNPQTNWIPGPEQERRFAELVAQAELDPHAWIVYHYGLQLEAFGTTDRVMTINREWEIIERIKLAALGLSRSFLTGELTYASATAGLQVFLRRLQTMRSYFEQVWMRPKFFKPIAEINQFYKGTDAERSHGIRVKRTAQELREQGRLIIPKLDWANKLNPNVDKDLMDAYSSLEQQLGVRISKTKKMAVVNLSFEEELRKSIEEDKFENKIREEYGVKDQKGNPKEIQQIIDKTDETKQKPGETPPGGSDQGSGETGGKPSVSAPPPNPRLPPKPTEAPKKEPEADLHPVKPTADEQEVPDDNREPGPKGPGWQSDKNMGWDREDVGDLLELLRTGETNSAHWSGLKPRREMKTRMGLDGVESQIPTLVGYNPYRSLLNGDPEEAWEQVDSFLQEEGYPDKDVEALRRILIAEGVLPKGALEVFEEQLPDDTTQMGDEEFGNLFAKSLETASPFGEASVVADRIARTLSKPDAFLVGLGADREIRRRQGTPTSFTEAIISPESQAYDVRTIASKDQLDRVIHGQNCSCHRRAIKTPHFDAPDNHESREDWQKRLDHSKITPDAKRYIRQIENEMVDGWSKSFDQLWKDVERRLNGHEPIDSNVLSMMISQNVKNHLDHLDHGALDNAFTGLYSEGKEVSYKSTSFKDKKLDKLKKSSSKTTFLKEAVTIDTQEDKLMLEQIKQTALEKVKSITNSDLRTRILEKLTSAGSENVNPIELANQIIKEEAEKKKEKLKNTVDEESRAQLKGQLKALYEGQAYQLQRIMRTEAVNGFVLSQLMGFREQGIEKAQWNSHNDLSTCNLCKTLNTQQFDVEYLLSEGGRYPLTFLSHPQCRCWFTPVIAYVTLDEFIQKYEDSHPEKFVQGETLINESKFDPEDLLKEVTTLPTAFKKVPVEHVDLLKQVADNVSHSPYEKHTPHEVMFVKDVYDLDEFQSKAKPDENLTGRVNSWHDSDTNTTYVSSYASEFDPINEVYLRDWANRIWEKESSVRDEWKKLYKAAPDRGSAEALKPETLEILRTVFKPFPLGQTYYIDGGDALGFTTKMRESSDGLVQVILDSNDISPEEAEIVQRWRRFSPIWNLESGKVVNESEESDQVWVNHEASEDPESFFRESLVSYVSNPHNLEMRDPKLYVLIRNQFFDGKEFKS